MVEDSTNRFRNYLFVWNFGDPGSGTWGTDGRSKNVEYGAAAAHVYETAGVYTITLTVYEWSGGVLTAVGAAAESIEITITDPDTVYSTTNTICVNPDGDSDFTGKPTGATEVSTDDLTAVDDYATAGKRVLFKRGCAWTGGGLSWPNSAGPVTIGAYGTGAAPVITVNGDYFLSMGYKQDWRVMDLAFANATKTYTCLAGSVNIQKFLMLNLTMTGFYKPIEWGHYNADPAVMKEDIAVVECDISGMNQKAVAGGSDRLALLGNVCADSEISHIFRVFQAYQSVIEHNDLSGADLDYGIRHVLKFQSPTSSSITETPSPSSGEMTHFSKYTMVSDNLFGRGGGWPVNIAPENDEVDEDLEDIIFERNRVVSEYGSDSGTPVAISIRYANMINGTIRNNVCDGKGSGTGGYVGIAIAKEDAADDPSGNEIYNNTIYNPEASDWTHRGISICASATGTIAKNNLASFPNEASKAMFEDDSADLVESNNLLTDTPGFIDPDNPTPLNRNFDLLSDSAAVDYGIDVNVYRDFVQRSRVYGAFDAGAYEYTVSPSASKLAMILL